MMKKILFLAIILTASFNSLKAQDGYSFTLIENSPYNYSLTAIANYDTGTYSPITESYGFTLVVPDGITITTTDIFPTGATETINLVQGTNVSSIDSSFSDKDLYVITINTAAGSFPTHVANNEITLVTFTVDGSPTSGELTLLDNNSNLASSPAINGALDSFLQVDTTDDSVVNFSDAYLGQTGTTTIDLTPVCNADAGTLTADEAVVTLVGSNVNISATPDGNVVVPTGYETLFVLTSGPDLVIQNTNSSPSFDVDTAGDYTIHTLVAETSDISDPNYLDLSSITLGTTTANDVLNGISTICASLDAVGAQFSVEDCTADAGTLTADEAVVTLVGSSVNISATPDGSAVVPAGYETLFVLTSGTSLVIQNTSSSPSFDVDTAGDYTIHTLIAETSDASDPNYLDLSGITLGTSTANDVLNIISTICASLDTVGAQISVEDCIADAGTLTSNESVVTLVGSSVNISATPDGNAMVPAGYETLFVLTSEANLVIQNTSSSPSFDVDTAGDYAIHTLIAETSDASDSNYLDLSAITLGTTTANDVLNAINSICASLDAVGAQITVEDCTADAGTLTADEAVVTLVGSNVNISATPDGNVVIPTGYETLFVLTSGTNLVIQNTSSSPSFDVDTAGDYTIHTLIAETSDASDPNYLDLSGITLGITAANDVLNIISTNMICSSLDVVGAQITVEDCTADAGTLTADEAVVTLLGSSVNISASPDGNAVIPAGYETLFVLTSGTGLVIQNTNSSPNFDVDTAGDYSIHTLIAETSDASDPNYLDLSGITLGTATANDVLNAISTICASLDTTGATITVEDCTTDAGTLTADEAVVTLLGSSVNISATPDGNAVVPAGYETLFFLTSGTNLVIQNTGTSPNFDVDAAGDYTIHTLIAETSDASDPNYLDLSGITLGTTTANDVLNAISSICASLDVTGATITVEDCTTDAGTLTADEALVTLVGSSVNISAAPDGNAVVPADYETLFVLTSGTGLVIQNTSSSPDFDVDTAGDYTIHSLIAETSDPSDPNYLDLSGISLGTTTANDVLNIISTICASLDAVGAQVTVEDCTADAGTLTSDEAVVTLVGSSVNISATPDGNASVPAGYETLFVLTSGANLVIQNTSSSPNFDVDTAGDYAVHTLIAETSDASDPNYLDLSGITLGTTTANDVLNVISTICASLDAEGAQITVEDCSADAGTLTADDAVITLVGSNVNISATPDGNTVVPADYETLFVLTSGANLVIQNTSTSPSFDVDVAGDYIIHTLIAEISDSTDLNYLDLSGITLGASTANDVLNTISTNMICASLNAVGSQITVEDCIADAGTLTSNESVVTLVGSSVNISATPDGNAVVPAGYETLFVLTSGPGLLIQNTNSSPSFDVDTAGDYAIHTLIAETSDPSDPNYLDLSGITLGTTNANDVLNIISTICASLDAVGAQITLEDCTADAGTLTADEAVVTLVGSNVNINAAPDGNAVVPGGYETLFVLTSGTSLVIQNTSTSPSFDVDVAGDYIIHTLIAETSDASDPNYLDLSGITLGTTTTNDVLNTINTNMICASLDNAGAQITVDDTMSVNDNSLSTLQLAFNPVKDYALLLNEANLLIHSIEIYDLRGKLVEIQEIYTSKKQVNINTLNLSNSSYVMIVKTALGLYSVKFLKN